MTRSVPVMAQEVPGNFITAALYNATVKGLGDFTLGVPVFSGYQATAQSVATGTWTAFTIDTELVDTDGGHSTVTNTSRYTATVPGLYLAIGTSGWASNTTGFRRVRLTLNGVAILGAGAASDAFATSGVLGHCTSTFVTLNGTTDYVEVQGYQSSGGALNTNANSDMAPSLRLAWIRS